MAMIARMGRILNWERSLWGAEDGRGGGEDLGALLEDKRCADEDRTGWMGVKAGLEKTPDAKRRAIGRDMRCDVQVVRCDEKKRKLPEEDWLLICTESTELWELHLLAYTRPGY